MKKIVSHIDGRPLSEQLSEAIVQSKKAASPPTFKLDEWPVIVTYNKKRHQCEISFRGPIPPESIIVKVTIKNGQIKKMSRDKQSISVEDLAKTIIKTASKAARAECFLLARFDTRFSNNPAPHPENRRKVLREEIPFYVRPSASAPGTYNAVCLVEEGSLREHAERFTIDWSDENPRFVYDGNTRGNKDQLASFVHGVKALQLLPQSLQNYAIVDRIKINLATMSPYVIHPFEFETREYSVYFADPNWKQRDGLQPAYVLRLNSAGKFESLEEYRDGFPNEPTHVSDITQVHDFLMQAIRNADIQSANMLKDQLREIPFLLPRILDNMPAQPAEPSPLGLIFVQEPETHCYTALWPGLPHGFAERITIRATKTFPTSMEDFVLEKESGKESLCDYIRSWTFHFVKLEFRDLVVPPRQVGRPDCLLDYQRDLGDYPAIYNVVLSGEIKYRVTFTMMPTGHLKASLAERLDNGTFADMPNKRNLSRAELTRFLTQVT